jgi:N6-adenosine-specific RNA methylase IME4
VKYTTVVVDPPWNVRTGSLRFGVGEGGRGIDNRSRPLPYATMTLADIHALPVSNVAASSACLYLWTINAYVRAAYDVAESWGFSPSTLITWAKAPMGGGLGGDWGISTEHVLFCRRGKGVKRLSRAPSTWYNWKRPYDVRGKPRHSAKPPEFYDLVERVSPGPYAELFARELRSGWDVWGDQVENDPYLRTLIDPSTT